MPMKDREYWFARRFPLGDTRQGNAPVHWKGYAAALVFASALTVGGVAFAWLGGHGEMFIGAVVFGAVALVAGVWFTMTAKANGDPSRTVAAYGKDRRQRA